MLQLTDGAGLQARKAHGRLQRFVVRDQLPLNLEISCSMLELRPPGGSKK